MGKASRSSIQGGLGCAEGFGIGTRGHPSVLTQTIAAGGLGCGEGFGIGTGGHPSVLKSHKTRQGASRNRIKPLPQHG